MNEKIIGFINQTYGCAVNSSYYANIDTWTQWWRGYVKTFHHYATNNGKKRLERDLYSLKMGKKVCEDWASMLFNEKTNIVISDDKVSEFVLGTGSSGGVLGANDFWVQGCGLIEKAFATGTGAVTIRLENAHMTESGELIGGSDTGIRLSYTTAEYIIPISYQGSRITEAAFLSEHVRRGKKYLLCEVHVLESGRYVIHNHWFSADNDILEEKNPEDIPGTVRTGADVPWFSVFTPNIENNIEGNNGLGISVLHGGIDNLKGVDLAYNNLNKDFELGGKKVFMLRDMLETLSDGTQISPDDVGQQLFSMFSPDNPNPSEQPAGKFIHEFNPELRVRENTEGIQAQLDYLSFKCGLGNKHYQFNAGSVVTATQYRGDNQDLIRSTKKHYVKAKAFLISLVRSVIHIGHVFCGLGGGAPCGGEYPNAGGCRCTAAIDIVFDNSVLIDEATERENDRQDVRDKTMSRWEYRMKYRGETEEEARKAIEDIDGEDASDMYEGDYE